MAAAFTHLLAPDGTTTRVKQGFSWPAFLLGPLWAIGKREWRLALVLSIVYALLIFIDLWFVQPTRSLLPMLAMLAAYTGYMVVCGVKGNAWLLAALLSKGHVPTKEGNAT
jgi:hypothetical protein